MFYSNELLLVTLLPFLVVHSQSMDVNNGGGEIIRGLPCIKRLNQLFCGSAGNSYPMTKISTFIDDNKALLRRMYGELQEPRSITKTTVRVVRTFSGQTSFAVSAPLIQAQFASPPQGFQSRFRRDILEGTLDEMTEFIKDEEEVASRYGNRTESEKVRREKRQAEFPGIPEQEKNSNKEDVCQSKIEITTPYWASNSNGKVRAILNNKEFEQAIHQEICSKSSTARCNRDCSCEQKYKWHRLLAYDPNNDCAGIFMDWFLFPSCCVCRCKKNPFLTK